MQVGDRLGRLTILELKKNYNSASTWTKIQVKCDCGTVKWVTYTNLQAGHTRSCGCLKKEQLRAKRKFEKTALRKKFNYYKRNARTRNLKWDMDFEEFCILVHGFCYFCKHPGRTELKTHYGKFGHVNGVDRLNSSEGYESHNCVSCCEVCNRAKGNLSVDEFLAWLKEAYGYSFYGG